MDFRLEEGQEWRRMTSAQATQRRKKMPSAAGKVVVGDEEIDSILDDGPAVSE